MLKKLFFILLILGGIFIFRNTTQAIKSGDVIINEIAWMGTEISSTDEWIELHNTSSSNVDLTGWKLEGIGEKIIELNGVISEQGYFLLERTDDTTVPGISADIIYTGNLSNSGTILILRDQNNDIIDQVSCSDGWLKGDNSTKQTMEKIIDGWQTSSDPGGTPKDSNSSGELDVPPEDGEEPPQDEEPEDEVIPETTGKELNFSPIADAGNDIITNAGTLVHFDGSNSSDPDGEELNYFWNLGDGNSKDEAVFDYAYNYPGKYLVSLEVSDGKWKNQDSLLVTVYPGQVFISELIPDPEGSDEENEWIELYNASSEVVDISGWQLDDEEGGSSPFVFPAYSLMAPESFLVLSRKVTKISFNNDSDQARLLYPVGEVADEVAYEEAKSGYAAAKKGESFFWTNLPTPGIENLIFSEETQENLSQLEIKEITDESSSVTGYVSSAPKEVLLSQGKNLFSLLKNNFNYKVRIPSLADLDEVFQVEEAFAKNSNSDEIISGSLKASIEKLSLNKFSRKIWLKPEITLLVTSILSSLLFGIWIIMLKNRYFS